MQFGTDPVSAIGFMMFLFAIFCACLGESVKKETKKRSEVHEGMERMPSYIQKQYERTSSMKDQRRFYTTDEMRVQKRPIPGVARSLSRTTYPSSRKTMTVKALRGGEFIGNRMRFKVKVLNDTQFTITDVRVFLISYPSAALRLASDDDDEFFPKIEPAGFRSPTFDFLPTQDCVRGEIIAGVSFMDMRGNAQTLTTKPFTIRSVCDLLIPDQIGPEEFAIKLKEHECGEIVVKVQEWTAEEMYEKSLHLIEDANFYEVESSSDEQDGIFHASISGLAKGKYTGKSIGVKILVSGPANQKGASCTIQVTGEDQAMILPAIDDLRERLSAWLCPLCGSPLTLQNVEDLKDGKAVVCPFCNVSIGR
ncbi:hypothetical protein EU528_08415 [Candidatus Thorarchaeota archaeon]|nr:MAG: hypothetical protein EU528_08415 [Candidatus Thorarchaeota archaeon]